MKTYKKLASGLSVMLIIALLAAGCGANSGGNTEAASADMTTAETYAMDTTAVEEAGGVADMNQPATEDPDQYIDDNMEVDPEFSQDTIDDAAAASQQQENRKLITTEYLTVETKTFDTLSEALTQQVEAAGGYIQSMDVYGDGLTEGRSRYASYVLRIPSKDAPSFVENLRQQANVISYSRQVEDVTLNYVDTQSRINSLKTEQEALNSMLEQAGDLDALLSIQSRLTEVRAQLESYESQLRVYDNQIDYSTIYLDINEVEREQNVDDTSFGAQLVDRLGDTWYNMIQGFRSFALWFLGSAPVWILLAIVVIAVVFVLKKVIKRKRKINTVDGEKTETNTEEQSREQR